MTEKRTAAEQARADRVSRIIKIIEERRADIERMPKGSVVVHLSGTDISVELRSVYREN